MLFVAKTNDETLESLSSLREEDVKIQKMAGKVLTDSYSNSRIKASFIVGEDNDTPRRNSALANAQGRWNPIVACLMTIRNMCYGVVKWMKYVRRNEN